jgi:WD40 repeat protein
MKLSSFSKLSILLLLALAACAGKPSPTSTPTRTAPALVPTPTSEAGIIEPENAQRLFLVEQLSMGAAIGSPMFSPDGKWLYQATTSGVFVFDTSSYANSRLLVPYSTTEYEDLIVGLSPDGKTLAMGNDLVRTADGQMVNSLDVSWPGTRALAFSPDGSLLARGYDMDSASKTQRVGIWRVADSSLLQTIDVKTLGPMAFSSDGRLLSVQSQSSDFPGFSVFDTQTGQASTNWAGDYAFFLPENQLGVESSDGTLRIYSLGTNTVQHAFYGEFVGASPDGKLIAVLIFGQFKIFRILDEQLLATLDTHLTPHIGGDLRFSPDGQTVAVHTVDSCCGGHIDTLSLWRVTDGTLIKTLDIPSGLFNFSPDGKTLAVTVRNDSTQIIDTTDGSLKTSAGAYDLHASGVAFSSDGRQLVIAGIENDTGQIMSYRPPLFFYDLESGNLVKHLTAGARNPLPPSNIEDENYFSGQHEISSGCCVAVSPNGKKAASNSQDGFVVFDESSKATLLSVSYDIPLQVISLSFSPDGQRLAVVAAENSIMIGYSPRIQVWEAVLDGEKIMELIAPTDTSMVDYSPDGRYIAAGGPNGVIVWNASDGSIRFSANEGVEGLEPFGAQGASRLAFSPDGRILAIGVGDGTVELWDPQKGEKLYSVKATPRLCVIYNLTFSPDGRLLAAGFDDGGVRIYGIK